MFDATRVHSSIPSRLIENWSLSTKMRSFLQGRALAPKSLVGKAANTTRLQLSSHMRCTRAKLSLLNRRLYRAQSNIRVQKLSNFSQRSPSQYRTLQCTLIMLLTWTTKSTWTPVLRRIWSKQRTASVPYSLTSTTMACGPPTATTSHPTGARAVPKLLSSRTSATRSRCPTSHPEIS